MKANCRIITFTLALSALPLLGGSEALAWSSRPEAPQIKAGGTVYNQVPQLMNFYKELIRYAPGNGLDLDLKFANGFQKIQDDVVNNFIKAGAHILLIDQVDLGQAAATLEKARSHDIPVVFFDRRVDPKVISSWDKAWYVGPDDADAGSLQGHMLIDEFYVHENFDRNQNRTLDFVIVRGPREDLQAETRTSSCLRAFTEENLRHRQIAVIEANWTREDARQRFAKFIRSKGIEGFDAVIANNDEMALGVIDVLKEQGYNLKGPDHRNYIPVLGIDGTPEAITAVKNGLLLATAYNDTQKQIMITLRVASALVSGQELNDSITVDQESSPRMVAVPYAKVTRFNVDLYKH